MATLHRRLLVRLRSSVKASSSQSDGYLRRPAHDIQAFSEENTRYVNACREKIEQSLPEHSEVEPLRNLNVLVVSVPISSDLEHIKRQIEDVCEDVDNITEDFGLKAAR